MLLTNHGPENMHKEEKHEPLAMGTQHLQSSSPQDHTEASASTKPRFTFSSHWKSGVMVSSTFRVERVMGCRCTDSSNLGNRCTYLWMVLPIFGIRMSSPVRTQEGTGAATWPAKCVYTLGTTGKVAGSTPVCQALPFTLSRAQRSQRPRPGAGLVLERA